jgi:hypothetical protein
MGPTQLNDVPAIYLAETGALTGLLDDGRIISTNLAKWRVVEHAVARGLEGDALAAALSSIRQNSPATVDRAASRIYAAHDSSADAALLETLSQVMAEVAGDAMAAADPEAVFAYLQVRGTRIKDLADRKSWRVCVLYVDGHGAATVIDGAAAATRDEMMALAALVRSAGERHWTKVALPSWAETEARQVLAKTPRELLRTRPDARLKCLWAAALTSDIEQLGPRHGVAVARWIADQQPKQ